MKTQIVLEVEHTREVPNLAERAAQRTYTLDGVDNCEVLSETQVEGMDSQMGALDD